MNRRAQAHAKHRQVCPRCGKVCHGNGYANHRRMHQRERLRAAGVPQAMIDEIMRDCSLKYAEERIEGFERRAAQKTEVTP